MPLPVSIVINTYNRASTLSNTLESLPYLDHPLFEVIVVNGPSSDNTEDILRAYQGRIKCGRCPEANLSISRNFGIALAEGEIVAFIDDDAVPEPEWLSRAAAAYDSDDVGGAGGFVYDHTGYEFQSRHILCDRVGNAVFGCPENPNSSFNFPYTQQYCSLMGTNATYRRSVLEQIGGFDEYFAYYLDETDVCLRIVDRGYRVLFLDDAFVHHKFAASHLRDTRRVLKDRTQIARSKGYFTIRNSRGILTDCEAFAALRNWLEIVQNGIRWETDHGFISPSDKEMFFSQLRDGLQEGIEEARHNPRKLLSHDRIAELRTPFIHFPQRKPDTPRLRLCYLSQDYPPGRYGGIGKWTYEIAREIGGRGHYVHVVTRGEGHDRVDFEEGVWVHRIVPKSTKPGKLAWDLPRNILDYADTAHQEVKRIDSHHKLDLVISPLWDHEGIACLSDPDLRTIVTLQTTFKLMLDSHPEWNCDENHRINYIDKMIRAEYEVLRQAPHVLSNSRAMFTAIRDAYAIELGDRAGLSLLGIEDQAHKYQRQRDAEHLRVLFVGRLEKRKGIDLLLRCIPGLCRQFPALQFVIVGEDTLKNENNRTFREDFIAEHNALLEEKRVVFTGRVSDEELLQHYADCDIFVSPSIFESFGLIFIEAMMFSKPVVGCRAGGMVEIIRDGENGFLAQPGDWISLFEALLKLIESEQLRERFGRCSRDLFTAQFTRQKMADDSLAYCYQVLKAPPMPVTEVKHHSS